MKRTLSLLVVFPVRVEDSTEIISLPKLVKTLWAGLLNIPFVTICDQHRQSLLRCGLYYYFLGTLCIY
ncbi:hypothetical protein SADUNF_Sadunf01G0168000 [Salix dunnii]|uniref:Uncharacterized protein n=1 Tax=Salix dunnii TaxID=1413687 RepID=A0A835NBK5_9ROSI|nr:hypothetical protein SADUNF_Sadunf01G0168000 [Salix dunnii]